MKTKIEEIAFLAREKGFEAKTLSTKFTINAHLGINKSKTFLINETCDYLLLAEMQKWLRDTHQIHIKLPGKGKTYFCIVNNCDIKGKKDYTFKSYEEALGKALIEGFKLIK